MKLTTVFHIGIFVAIAAAGCAKSKPVSEDDVVSYLAKADQPTRNAVLQRAGLTIEASPATAPERTDLVARGDRPLTLVGTQPDVGDVAPDVVLEGDRLSDIRLSELRGKALIISVVPSIDTPVCEAQTHRMTEEEATLSPNTKLITISRDLPFAQARFVEASMITTTMASDFHGGAFGKSWGLEVKETGLLARSVWVLDATGTVVYRELVADQGSEPNYEAALAAARALD